MTKREKMENEFREIFGTLMSGERSEFKQAKKRIDRLWHADTETFQKAAPLVLEYIPRFEEVKMPENQAAFVSGLNLFYLSLGDDHFETLKNFTLKLLQHPHGHVREAMRHTADWLHMSLSSRLRPFVYPAGKPLTDEQKRCMAEAEKQYAGLLKELEALLDKYDQEDDDSEYIDEMKPSISKSLNQFWGQITRGRMYREFLEKTTPIPTEVYVRRKEIEQELADMLRKTKSDFDVDDIRDVIFNEDGSSDLQDIISMFDRGGDVSELSDILEIVTDAWNYFPHRSLDGLSPTEKALQARA
ncbi:MAG: hypothetical protein KGI49_03125 [Patescibacteria group bacterium]|nr:hypothetical protein [Patescibacteria group bacterium]